MDSESITLARELRRVATRLAYFQDDGEYSYVDKFEEVTSWISRTCRELINVRGATVEEEAELCLSILTGYSTTVREEDNIRHVILRSKQALAHLADTPLKCQLLIYCYFETDDYGLVDIARRIMKSLKEKGLSEEGKIVEEKLEELSAD